MSLGLQAVIAGALSGLVGFAELLARYRSDPSFAYKTLAAITYIGINAAAGIGALYLVHAFNWNFGQTKNVTLWQILVAGFGAVALFRSSLFTTRVGSTDVNVGPSVVLSALLDACDRQVDRQSADKLADVMKDENLVQLDPQAVMTALPVLCLALMQNFAAEDQALLGTELLKIRNDTTLSDATKMRAVVVQLAKFLGDIVVTRVLKNGNQIFAAAPAILQAPVPSAPAPSTLPGTVAALSPTGDAHAVLQLSKSFRRPHGGATTQIQPEAASPGQPAAPEAPAVADQPAASDQPTPPDEPAGSDSPET